MIQYHVNNLATSRRAILLAVLSCLVVFLFVWQGVDSMFSVVAIKQHTLLRLIILSSILLSAIVFGFYVWTKTLNDKAKVLEAYANSLEEVNAAAFDEESKVLLAQLHQAIEETEFMKRNLQNPTSKENTITIPFNLPIEKRNCMVFRQQKGANGQTVYEYSYIEVINGIVIIGRANISMKLYSTSDKRDSFNRMVGIEEKYTSDSIVICKLIEYPLDAIPDPYKHAIVFGAINIDTALSVIRKLPPLDKKGKKEVEVGEKVLSEDKPLIIDL